MPGLRAGAAIALPLALLALAAGCGGGEATSGSAAAGERGGGETTSAAEAAGAAGANPAAGATGTDSAAPPAEPRHRFVRPSHCPAGVAGCRETVGRIVYVERVDPDGDGDAHFVILDPQGITLPGLTAIDVRAGLRPHPLPGPGDLVSAAGPVQVGSYGQEQIHALELHVGAPG